MALEKFKAPALPFPTDQYSRKYIEDLVRSLRLYFQQLDSLTPNQALSYRADEFIGGNMNMDTVTADTVDALLFKGGDIDAQQASLLALYTSSVFTVALEASRIVSRDMMANNFYGNFFYGDGRFLNVPYNQFLSNVDQTAAAIDQAYALQLEVTSFADGIYISGTNNTRITFSQPGVYTVNYSLSFKNTTNDGQTIDIWIRYNGTDYPDSNSRFFVPARKSTGDPSFLIAVTSITGLAQNANDYVEIMWRVSDVNVIIEHLPAVTAVAGVTPAIPATPSAIVQANFVSAEYPPVKRVAPLPVFGFGEVGRVDVVTT